MTKAQTPAEGILLVGEFGTSKWYHIRCECGSDDCSHEIEVEADEGEVSVHIHVRNHTKWWEKNRWQQIWQLISRGYSDMQTTIVLSEQTAVNYAETLKSAVKDVKTLRAELIAKRKVDRE